MPTVPVRQLPFLRTPHCHLQEECGERCRAAGTVVPLCGKDAARLSVSGRPFLLGPFSQYQSCSFWRKKAGSLAQGGGRAQRKDRPSVSSWVDQGLPDVRQLPD